MGKFIERLRRRVALERDARVLEQSGLLNERDYLRRYPDIAASGMRPVLHFLRHGAEEGRNPSAYFDTGHYVGQRKQALRESGANPLIDFLRAGGVAGASPHPLFDPAFYRRRASISEQANPLLHYLREGWKKEFDPSPMFNVRAYLAANPDVRDAGLEPLGHFLAFGLAEGRGDRPGGGVQLRPSIAAPRGKAPPMRAPGEEAWRAAAERIAAHRPPTRPLIDVIIPVYRGRDETLACIYAAVASEARLPHRIVVLNDASPDADLGADLVRLSGLGLFDLVVNETNLGFVRTCNRGMALHPDRDVVLLNSDAEVYGDWLDRLYRAAWSRSRVATVTPLSNNAEIFSYPTTVFDNDRELEIPYAELDAMAARVNAERTVEAPTGVGFCLYVRRDCICAVGTFDEQRFGKGYGEENDFCLRAGAAGWVNLLACDVFVRHAGGVSFGPEKLERSRRAQALLAETFPDYAARVQDFVSRDPARPFRRALDLERLRLRLAKPSIAMIVHNLGGGTERHVQELSRSLEAEGVGVVQIRPDRLDQRKVWLLHPDIEALPNLGPFDPVAHPEPLAAALARVGVFHLHVHHLLGTDVGNTDWVAVLAAMLACRYDVTAHDFFAVCPRITLIDGSGKYCHEPEPAGCDRCLAANGSPAGTVTIGAWRARFGRLLHGARAVFAPSEDTVERHRRYFPGAAWVVRPHAEVAAEGTRPEPAAPPPPDGGVLRVAILGALVKHKGYQTVRSLADDARSRDLPIQFVLYGYSEDDPALLQTGKVEISGPYIDTDLPRLLREGRCRCALFPAVWPETYSYTLSHALRAGLYPVVTDLGAPAERVRRAGWGTILPHDMAASALNDALLSLSISRAPADLAGQFASYPSYLKDYYGLCSPPQRGAKAQRSPERANEHGSRSEARISVAMATYNGQEFLREQLNSIARQERLPDELVVCDDASTDDTWAILERFQGEAPFAVRAFRNPINLGSTRTFEKAVRLARGGIIALADQDDVWASEKLAISAEALAVPGVSMVFTDGLLVGPRLQSLGRTQWQTLGFTAKDLQLFERNDVSERLLRQNVVTGCASAFWSGYRSLVLPISSHWVHDYWLAVLLSAVGRLAPVAAAPLLYRQHGRNQIGASIERDRPAGSWLGSIEGAPRVHFSLSPPALSDLCAQLDELISRAGQLGLDEGAIVRLLRVKSIAQAGMRVAAAPVHHAGGRANAAT